MARPGYRSEEVGRIGIERSRFWWLEVIRRLVFYGSDNVPLDESVLVTTEEGLIWRHVSSGRVCVVRSVNTIPTSHHTLPGTVRVDPGSRVRKCRHFSLSFSVRGKKKRFFNDINYEGEGGRVWERMGSVKRSLIPGTGREGEFRLPHLHCSLRSVTGSRVPTPVPSSDPTEDQ